MQINPTTQGSKLCTYARMRQSLFQGFAACARMRGRKRGWLAWCRSSEPPPTPTYSPRNAPLGYVTAMVQRRNETERALSHPTCPTRPGEPPTSARSSPRGIIFSDATRAQLCSLANLRCEPRGSRLHLFFFYETTQCINRNGTLILYCTCSYVGYFFLYYSLRVKRMQK